ncbi:hypothetical protein MNEG_0763 [Monoraphidium neglectum]|uniref:GmrSD restriction endonucleases N-terminal domain-containing protein n=1 Tax=Monoraphidium neglectum TaxID=145388 RepID=A0A0D2LLH2_9CHLO|nr:hypothetical protein MNEG_0763 [Monoraphidium neglectum]KIZ07189.1 hypothetical protein MNEG_0763 [Monoraphidium neglectum]|eukprot:XP_013906208.1 hypothetical protein MNEG_0763 [Monoraphidium neglectum]
MFAWPSPTNVPARITDFQASGLVLTVLGERLVQPVILEETTDSRYSPIDGKQRLASLLSFLNGERLWEHAPVELVVSNDDDDEDAWFHGKTYKDLGKEWQRRFGNYTLHCVIITNDTDPDVIFKIYDDLNSGGRDHTKQQIRKAAFHGSYMSLLEDLIKTPDFKEEVDRELVLRYFAMKNGGDDFKGSLTKWLNSEAKQRRNADTAAFSRDFSTTLSVARAIFGNSAFRHPGVDTVKKAKASSKGPTSNIHPYLWDTIMVVLSDALKMQGRPRLQQRGDAIKAAYQQLWQNPQWLDAMEKRLSAASIMLRRDLFKAHILPPDGFV